MGKFCSHCGAAITEGAAFCQNCGNPLSQEAPAAPQFIPAEQATPAPQFIPAEQAQPQFIPAEPVAPAPQFIPADQAQPQFIPADQAVPQFVPAASVVPAAPAKKKPSKKALIIGGVIAAVAVVAIILFVVLGSGSAMTAEAAFDNYIALYNGDTDKLEGMAPEEYWQYGAKEEEMSVKALLAEMKQDIRERDQEMKEEYGNYKITGQVLAEDDMDKDTLNKIKEALSEYGIKPSSIKEGKDLTVKMTLKTSEGTEEAPTQTLSAIKIDSSWYLIRYYEYGDGEFNAYFIVR